MPEHAGCLAPVVHSERYGTGEHFSTNVDTLLRSLSPEGPAHAESSVTASGPMASGVLGRDAGQSPQCLFETFSLGQNPKSHSFFTADVLAVMRGHDPHHEAARGQRHDRPLAIIKLESFRPAPPQQGGIGTGGCWCGSRDPGTHAPIDGRKSNAGRGERCCQEVPLERGIQQGRPESMDFFVLALCYVWARLSRNGSTRASVWISTASPWQLGHTRSCLDMLSELSTELKGLGFSLFKEIGKCAWMGIGIDELAPVYFEGNLVTRVNSFCVLGSIVTSEYDALVTLQHRTTLALGQFI